MKNVSDQKPAKSSSKYRIELWAIFLIFLVVALFAFGKDSLFYIIVGFCVAQAASEILRASGER